MDRSTTHKIDDNSSDNSLLANEANSEMHTEEDNDTTLKENVEPLARQTTHESCDTCSELTDIETQSDRERTTSSTSDTHDESYSLPDCFQKFGIGLGRKTFVAKCVLVK